VAIDYTSDIGMIRLTIGDLDEDNLHFSNEQLRAYMTMTGNIVLASIYACRAWASELSSTSGDIYRVDTIEYQEGKSKVGQLMSILKSLEDSIANGTNPMLIGVPYTTGIKVSDRDENLNRIDSGEIVGPQSKDDSYEYIDLDNQNGPYYEG